MSDHSTESVDVAATETRLTHYYEFYGRTLKGYGPSMDPHRCGDPSEPCRIVTEERTVSPWLIVSDVVTPTGENREKETHE
jgi:hypothetical protein